MLLGKYRILIVDDDIDLRDFFCDALNLFGYDVAIATSHAEAISKSKEEDFDLILQDVILDNWGCNGLDLLKEYKQIKPAIKVVIISGFAGNISWDTFKEAGAVTLWRKPISLAYMQEQLKVILK